FATDFRPMVDQLETWKFEAHAKSRDQMALQFEGVDAVPSHLNVYLIDQQRARYVDLRAEASYKFNLPTGSSEFNVIVGSEEAVREILNTVLPREFALGNNFPNPFNPTTSIPISVPHTADISLKVYNILGEEVRTVFAGTIEAGGYFFTWDGKNNAGNTVASGMYITRFTTNAGKAFTGKMIMMK
ncbi:MAG: FlgD immunoglobulin-like domain containing protein, partial [Bacteroidota bacterium]